MFRSVWVSNRAILLREIINRIIFLVISMKRFNYGIIPYHDTDHDREGEGAKKGL